MSKRPSLLALAALLLAVAVGIGIWIAWPRTSPEAEPPRNTAVPPDSGSSAGGSPSPIPPLTTQPFPGTREPTAPFPAAEVRPRATTPSEESPPLPVGFDRGPIRTMLDSTRDLPEKDGAWRFDERQHGEMLPYTVLASLPSADWPAAIAWFSNRYVDSLGSDKEQAVASPGFDLSIRALRQSWEDMAALQRRQAALIDRLADSTLGAEERRRLAARLEEVNSFVDRAETTCAKLSRDFYDRYRRRR